MNTELKIGDQCKLKVLRREDRNKLSLYIVEHDGKEYAIKLFDFQKTDPLPEELNCFVKDIQDGITFTQDFSPLYERFYNEGEVYAFTVKSDCTHLPDGYYEVRDRNGFVFRLIEYGKERLFEHQEIRCRVKKLNGNKLRLELITDKEENYLPFYTIEEISAYCNERHGHVKFIVTHMPMLEEAMNEYDKQNPRWILTALRILTDNMNLWVKHKSGRANRFISLYKNASLFLLEGSDYLAKMNEEERKYYQDLISSYVQRAVVFITAEDEIAKGTADSYIDDLIKRLSTSGYLYHPGKRLEILNSIFQLKPGMMDSKMSLIFDVILNGDRKNWKTEPFRSAFVVQLENYIQTSKPKLDRIIAAETPESVEMLNKMVTAISIQLLLSEDNDDIDRQLNMAILFRYLTLINGTNAHNLVEKAFACISDAREFPLEFGWTDTRNSFLMASKLSANVPNESSTRYVQTFEGNNAKLCVDNDSITIRPLKDGKKAKRATPADFLPWHNMQVVLNDSISAIKKDEQSLARYYRYWKEIEQNLFYGKVQESKKSKKVRPGTDDIVSIRVKYQSPEDKNRFFCEIVSDYYEGQGWLNIKNVVRYNVTPIADMQSFKDGNNSIIVKAQILGTDQEGQFHFSLFKPLEEYFRETYYFDQEPIKCKVQEVLDDRFVCVDEFGASVIVHTTDDTDSSMVSAHDYVLASVEQVKNSGQIEANYICTTVGDFTIRDAFDQLIYNFGEPLELSDKEEDEDMGTEETLDKLYVKEIILLIDRKAALEGNYIRTYNYLAFDRLLALLIGDTILADYYAQRMRFLQLLQAFVESGKVDEQALKEMNLEHHNMLEKFPLFLIRMTQLEIVSRFGNASENEYLWGIIQKGGVPEIINLARLTLTYNMLSGFNMSEQREAIKSKMSEILNINIKLPELATFGLEGQTQEFKTSFICPPGNGMKKDESTQNYNILKVICGMLNSTVPSTLYLGVNDEGVACGLEDDLKEFESKDKYDLNIRNRIKQELGTFANGLIEAKFELAGSKEIYVIKVTPSPHPISLKDQYFLRQGSSTYPVEKEIIQELRKVKSFTSEVDGDITIEAVDTKVASSEEQHHVQHEPTVEHRTIATSILRQNPTQGWEEDFGVDSPGMIHLLNTREYIVSENVCYHNDLALSIAIHNDDINGYLLFVYGSGRAMKVPMKDILEKNMDKRYTRYADESPIFVCPAAADDAVLMIYENTLGMRTARLDTLDTIKEGIITQPGERLTTSEFEKVVCCEIVHKSEQSSLKCIRNLKPNKIGEPITNKKFLTGIACLNKKGFAL